MVAACGQGGGRGRVLTTGLCRRRILIAAPNKGTHVCRNAAIWGRMAWRVYWGEHGGVDKQDRRRRIAAARGRCKPVPVRLQGGPNCLLELSFEKKLLAWTARRSGRPWPRLCAMESTWFSSEKWCRLQMALEPGRRPSISVRHGPIERWGFRPHFVFGDTFKKDLFE